MNESKKSLPSWLLPLLLLVGLLSALIVFLLIKSKKKQSDQQKEQSQNRKQQFNDLSEVGESMEDIVLSNITFAFPEFSDPYILLAQSAHETGNFTSEIFKENLNLFGMRHPEHRPTVSLGDKNGYAYYDSLADSVKDLRMWIEYNGLPYDYQNTDAYVTLIKSHSYFTASVTSYKNAVRKFYNQFNA